MKNFVFSALTGLALLSACKKDDAATPTMQVSGTLSGSNQLPAVAATGTGTVAGTYTPSTKEFKYTITYSGLTGAPTSAHLHYGDAKHKNDQPTVPFPPASLPTTASGTFSGTVTLNTMQADSLLANHIYTNIHTAANGGGEVRANLTAKY